MSLGELSLSPWYAPIRCGLETLSAVLRRWLHFEMQKQSANNKITNDITPTIDIQTTFLTVFFDPPEFEDSDAEGPSACFAGVFPDVGGAPEIGGDGVGGDGRVDGDGGGDGAVVELKGFPSFLQ